jgi:D-alanyl-D-alanine carboxypeptidase (penicillin-binding protein 5/6)
MKCVCSAVVCVLLIICTAYYGISLGEKSKINLNPAKEAAARQVVVEDYIHDNYVISEKNPWTDYTLQPIVYTDVNQAVSDIKISAKSGILIDINSSGILYEKNSDERRSPASTTKLMTALTVLQVMNLNDTVTVGEELNMVASDSSRAGFSKGQIVTVEELMNGMLIASGNDAAYILARAAGESIFNDNIENEGKTFTASQCVERFVLEMNKNVRTMELENTHFTSPDGYDHNDQYTTAGDLSKIAIRAYENKSISKICGRQSYYSKTLKKTWTNTNELLNKNGEFYYKYCYGLKTGSTDAAGKCLVSVGKVDDKLCLSVVLGDSTDEQRFNDSKTLLQAGLGK